jgi:hypothetical protein
LTRWKTWHKANAAVGIARAGPGKEVVVLRLHPLDLQVQLTLGNGSVDDEVLSLHMPWFLVARKRRPVLEILGTVGLAHHRREGKVAVGQRSGVRECWL